MLATMICPENILKPREEEIQCLKSGNRGVQGTGPARSIQRSGAKLRALGTFKPKWKL